MKLLFERWRGYIKEEEDSETIDIMHHASPPKYRESIKKQGLKPGSAASYGPPAVYLFMSELFAENYISDIPMDVWEVNTEGLTTYRDPEDPSAARYYEGVIEPWRLTYSGLFLEGEPLPHEDYYPEDWE